MRPLLIYIKTIDKRQSPLISPPRISINRMEKCKVNQTSEQIRNKSFRIEMAEAFLKTLEDFEQEWLDLGKEFEVVFDSG